MIYSLTVTNTIGESLTFELGNPLASGYAIKNIDGLGTPDMNVNTTPYGIGDGSVLGSIKAEYRLITIILWPLEKPTVETARQRLYRFFQIKKDVLLTFNTENRLVTIDGYVQKIEPNIFDNPETITIEFKCINPYFHRMVDDQTKFYGVAPKFEFPFSVEWKRIGSEKWTRVPLPSVEGLYPDDDVISTRPTWQSIAYGNGVFVALGRYTPQMFYHIAFTFYSKDGINWTKMDLPELPTSQYWNKVIYANGLFVAISSGSNRAAYSIDGIRWSLSFLPYEKDWSDLAYGNDIFLAIGGDDGKAAYSHNGHTWLEANVPSDHYWLYIYFGDDKFLLIAADDTVAYSSDGVSWEMYNGIEAGVEDGFYYTTYGDGQFISVPGRDTDRIYSSRDGINWSTIDLAKEIETPKDITFGNGKFFIVGYYGGCYSTDGINWTQTEHMDGVYLERVCYGDGKFLAFADEYAYYNIPPESVPVDLIEFSNYTVDNRMEIDYQGEIDAGIQITIECRTPPGDIIIYNVNTLEHIQIFSERIEAVSGAPLGPKDIIEINTESGNKYVRLLRNGIYYNILGAMNRGMTWFVLKQGPNIFTYTTSDEHAAIVMTFSYQDTYAAI